ncbi:hypothetical protein, partial [Ralstonia pseudosolanacearum]|uniref:hypothetical protein n=1 Tax=Ralstonia pseudosolanacearum TaxID=1310165 RepID=UPI003AAA460C
MNLGPAICGSSTGTVAVIAPAVASNRRVRRFHRLSRAAIGVGPPYYCTTFACLSNPPTTCTVTRSSSAV